MDNVVNNQKIMTEWKAGEFAELTGISRDTLLKWEESGLINVRRDQIRYRIYDLDTLRDILKLNLSRLQRTDDPYQKIKNLIRIFGCQSDNADKEILTSHEQKYQSRKVAAIAQLNWFGKSYSGMPIARFSVAMGFNRQQNTRPMWCTEFRCLIDRLIDEKVCVMQKTYANLSDEPNRLYLFGHQPPVNYTVVGETERVKNKVIQNKLKASEKSGLKSFSPNAPSIKKERDRIQGMK